MEEAGALAGKGRSGRQARAPCSARKRFSMVQARHRARLRRACGQGLLDPQFEGLCRFVAGTRYYFTSSCCSGRILLLDLVDDSKKNASFHAKWHRTVSLDELLEALEKPPRGVLWFKLEPFILHLGCPDLESARLVLEAKNRAGVKRGGFIVLGEGKFLAELCGTHAMALPVQDGARALLSRDYLAYVLEKANAKLEANYARLARLEREARRLWR